MAIKTLIFDFGNVVGFFDHYRALNRLAAHSRLSAQQMFAALIGGRLEDDCEAGRLSSAQFVRHVRDTCELSCSEEETAAALADIFWPNREVCELLPRLKPRHRLLLASNTNELHARHFRPLFAEALRHFDHLVLSFEVGARKPAAAFFEHCQRLAGCRPAECLFIDDLPANVAGARACGWHGIVYTGVEDLRRQLVVFGIEA